MGLAGGLNLQQFAEAGGVLVTLAAASYMPPEFGLTREIDARRPSSKIYAPGPIVDAEILHPKHPIFYGYHNNTIPGRYANGLFLDIPQRHRNNWVLMRFTGTVRSGHMRGNSQTETRPAIVDVPQEDGRIVLFATNPCYRWQNHGEFTMLFNTLLHFNDLGVVQASEQTNAARVQP